MPGEEARLYGRGMRRRIPWLLLAVPAFGVAGYSARYFTLDPNLFLAIQRSVYESHLFPLLPHVAGGVVALSVGPFQFLSGLRRRFPTLHRWIGRTYVAGAGVAGLAGIGMAQIAQGGIMAHLGFTVLGVMGMLFTGAGLIAILRRRIASHRAWMARSYAMIFAAVTFRAWVGVVVGFQLPFQEAYAVGAWVTPLINLVVTEYLLGRERRTLPSPRPVPAR